MQHSSGRRAYLAAGAKLVALLAIPFTLFRSAEAAQEVQVDKGAAGATADLTALQQRIDALEAKVQRMDDERSRIRAPLVVTGPDGSEIFVVDVDGAGRGRARVGLTGSSHLILGMNDQGSGISLKDSSGTTRAQIGAGSEDAFVWVEDNVAKSQLGTGGTGASATSGLTITKGDVQQIALIADKAGGALKTFDVAGTPIAEMSAAEDTPFLLYDLAGKPFFSVGLPETGKRVLTLGDPAATRVELGVTTDGTGAFVAMMDKAGMPRAIMNADEKEPPFAAYDGVKEVFAVGPQGQGGPFQMRIGDEEAASVKLGLFTGGSGSFVSVQDKAGAPRAIMNADEKEPTFAAYDGVNEVFAVGPKGQGGPFQMRVGEEEKGHASIGIAGAGGGALVSLFDNAGQLRATVSSDKSGAILLTDAEANPTFFVGQPDGTGPMQLVIGDDSKEHVDIGLFGGGAGAAGAYFTLYDTAGNERALISTDSTKLIDLYNVEGQPIFSVGTPGEGVDIALKVGNADKAYFQTGVLTDGTGSYLSLYDQGNTERAHITATEKSTQMQMNDANMRAELGSDPDNEGSAGVYLGKDDKDFATMHFNPADGGSAWIADIQGNGVARLGARKEGLGGQIALTGPGGGKVIAELWGAEAGGKMAVYDTSGSPRVHMEASDTGDFVVEGAGGSFVVKASDRALMQIANAGGDVVVEAFENTNGIGIVSTGPKTSGAAAMLGNMGVPASAIEGQK